MTKKELLKKIKYSMRFLPDKMYLQIYYFAQFRKFINFKNPKTYNEKLNWLKIHDRNPEYTKMVDKYEAKEYAKNIIGEEYIIPTLGVWNKFDDIDFDKLPNQFVLKCTHDSEGLVIVKDKSKLNINEAKKKIEKAMKYNFYYIGREFPYKNVKPRIIAEQYMEDKKYHELRDYKFFCFDGEPKMLYIATGRQNGQTTLDFFDLKFNHLNVQLHYPNSKEKIIKPINLNKMIKLSKDLSKGLRHIRIDFYEINGKVYFGEFTFYNFSGLSKFNDLEWDKKFGNWLNLKQQDKKIKVLNIVTQPLTTDGITTYLINYFNNINKNIIQFDFVCPSVIDIIKKQINTSGGYIYELKSRKRIIKYMYKLKKIIKENKYDIVHIHGSSSILTIELLISYFAGCKVRIVHSHNTMTRHPIIHKILYPLFKKLYTHAFACGKDAGNWLFKNEHFEIISNGSDVSKFSFNSKFRNEIRMKYHLDGKIVLGHVGTFNEQKNHEFLLKMFKKLTEKYPNKYKLVLVGAGNLLDKMKDLSSDLNIKKDVIFIGRTAEVNRWLSAMDIMILPSLYEGFPMVLVEWQIAGLPSIISDNVTSDVKLTNLVEFLSIDNSYDVWIDKISKIKLCDRNKSKLICIEKIKKSGFDIKENAKKLEEIYTVINERIK